MAIAGSSGAIDRFGFVTADIRRDLERYVALLREWQRTHNLVGRGELDAIWSRHVADSLQLIGHAPPGWKTWVDLGSGAGFPGLIIAIAAKGRDGPAEAGASPPSRPSAKAEVTLVEANMKKAAFLRAAIRETGAPARVATQRIEAHAGTMRGEADVVSARALAPLSELCALASPYLHEESMLLLLKGQDFVHEHAAASKAWDYDVVTIPSVTNPDGQVVAIRKLRPRVR